MSNQIVISSGAKVRNLDGVLTASTGVVSSVGYGLPNGVATLDGSGKIPVTQLPNSVMEFKGVWNAATNTPTLADGTGNAGDVYLCNVAGTVNFGAGPITFAVGDYAVYTGTVWARSSGATGTVTSVAVTESGDALTITGSPITTSGTINIGFAGSSAQYVAGDGSLVTFPTIVSEAQNLITDVYNETGATLTKGTVVYINGGHGNLPTVTKAIATGDETSAQTYGVVQADITNNNNGHVVVIGSLGDLDTQAYAAGTQLYLSSTTAGAWTSTKQYAPAHLVYVGIVVRSHPTQGVVEIRIQNGFELDELHNVSAQTPSNNQGLFYNSSNSLWENKSIATALGYTPANDSLVVHLAGAETITGAKTFTANNLFTTYPARFTQGVGISETASYGTISGYTVIAGATNGLALYLASGGIKTFAFASGTSNNTFTFPNSTGTLALTSDLSGYLPLTGGTLTGGLSIATFSYLTSRISLNNGASGGNVWSISSGNANNSTNNGLFTILNETTSGNLFVLSPTGKLAIGANVGTINPADAFAVYDTNTVLKAVDLSGNNSSVTLQATNSTAYVSAGYATTAIPLVLRTSNTDRLTIAATGAATFSSSVTATSGIFTQSAGTSLQALQTSATNSTTAVIRQTGAGGNGGQDIGLLVDIQGANDLDNIANFRYYDGSTYTSRMVIKRGGNVGIGTSSPYNPGGGGQTGLEIAGTNYSTIYLSSNSATVRGQFTADNLNSWVELGARTNHPLLFMTNNTERMRITSAGNVGIGTSSVTAGKLQIVGDAGVYTNWLQGSTSSSNSYGLMINAGTTSSDYTMYVRNAAQSSVFLYVRGDGYLYSASAWSGSDKRLKENITDLDNGLNKVLGLKARKFDFIDGFKNQYGFIAQELQEVIPDAVSVFDEEKELLAVKMDFIIPHLVKAIQELKQEIDELKNK